MRTIFNGLLLRIQNSIDVFELIDDNVYRIHTIHMFSSIKRAKENFKNYDFFFLLLTRVIHVLLFVYSLYKYNTILNVKQNNLTQGNTVSV